LCHQTDTNNRITPDALVQRYRALGIPRTLLADIEQGVLQCNKMAVSNSTRALECQNNPTKLL
jgi:hypothetical protein